MREAVAGRYTVERELGRGGMATVYLAEDPRHHRKVAIKLLDPELARSVGADRFLREIEIAARLQHPHILPLYDSGASSGVLYYVMPYVEGETLRDQLNREKQLSLDETLKITAQVASALSYAHSRGVVHRDIKPENIMMAGGNAVVADFGIARAVGTGEGPSLTQTGTVIGTPAYMSPEQSMGSGDIDGRSDQYSLACVVYEMLVGEPPFTGPSAQAVIARHTLDNVSPPTIVRATIPDAVEDAVLRALSKVPADRFATIAQFAEALAVPSVATGPRRRTTTTVARPEASGMPRALVLGLIAAVLVMGAWVTRSLWHGRPAAGAVEGGLDPHNVAVLYLEDLSNTRGLGYLADGLTEALIGQLASVQALHVISKNGVAPYRSTAISRDSIARALKVGSLIIGGVEDAGNRLRVTVRLIDGASGADIERQAFDQPKGDLLHIRDELSQQVAGFLRRRLGQEVRLREQKAGTENVDAWVLVQQAEKAGKTADSLSAAGNAAGRAQQLNHADSLLAGAEAADPAWVEPIVQRGWLAYRQSRMKGADPIYAAPLTDRGLAHAGRAVAKDPNHASALELRGTLHYWRWLLHLAPDKSAAAALLRDAEADLRSAVRLDPGLAGAWSTLSHLDYQIPDEVKAKIDAQRAYEADAYYASADLILWRLFTASYDLEQFVDAINWCDEGQRRFPGNRRFVQCQLWLLTTRAVEPDVSKAWRLVGEMEKLTPPQDWKFMKLNTQIIVAATLARAGKADSARALLAKSRGNPEVDPAQDLLNFEAFVRTLLGDKNEALELLKRYTASHPERMAELARETQWWFRDLRDDPRYQQLAGTGSNAR